jgi:hypothetical protein
MEFLNKLFKFSGLKISKVNRLLSFLNFFFEICLLNVLLCTELFVNKIKY